MTKFLSLSAPTTAGRRPPSKCLYSMLRGEVKKFELFDFSAALWAEIDAVGRTPPGDEDAPKRLPSILLDLWFRVGEDDLATAMSLLPSTGGTVSASGSGWHSSLGMPTSSSGSSMNYMRRPTTQLSNLRPSARPPGSKPSRRARKTRLRWWPMPTVQALAGKPDEVPHQGAEQGIYLPLLRAR